MWLPFERLVESILGLSRNRLFFVVRALWRPKSTGIELSLVQGFTIQGLVFRSQGLGFRI